ncbi:MAG: zf-HC2 domain-containing protein [Candidatus Zixiibacteriota bacterium]
MQCSDVRWQLSRFLDGATSPTEDDLIRDHLDQCPDCALRLVSNGRVDNLDLSATPQISANFTTQVLAYYPESPSGMMMVRHLAWAFLVSAGFAVAVYMFVRQMLTSAPLSSVNPIDRFDEGGIGEVVSVFASNPLLNYVLLAVLATILCVALVLFIDRPVDSHKDIARTNR